MLYYTCSMMFSMFDVLFSLKYLLRQNLRGKIRTYMRSLVLEPKFVFLDTTFFLRNNFPYQPPPYKNKFSVGVGALFLLLTGGYSLQRMVLTLGGAYSLQEVVAHSRRWSCSFIPTSHLLLGSDCPFPTTCIQSASVMASFFIKDFCAY